MALTPQTIGFIAQREGFTPTAYWDGDHYSIGYGTYATPDEVKSRAPISQDAAMARLQAEATKSAAYVDSVVKVPLSPNQHAALTSMAYNVGSFGPSMIDAINSGNFAAVPQHMAQYGAIDPAMQGGVANRRNQEIALWNGTAGGTSGPGSSAGGSALGMPSGAPNALLAGLPGSQGQDPRVALANLLAQQTRQASAPVSTVSPSGGVNLLAAQVRPATISNPYAMLGAYPSV